MPVIVTMATMALASPTIPPSTLYPSWTNPARSDPAWTDLTRSDPTADPALLRNIFGSGLELGYSGRSGDIDDNDTMSVLLQVQ